MLRSFRGRTPRVHPDAFVSETAYVIGDVEIGPRSGVWPGAVIRADFCSIRIGADTQIEDNVVLHAGEPMAIGDHVTVGHCVVIHGRTIGSHVLIGNNATVLEGSAIADFCVIGANALVSARMQVPEGSFVVGVPGEAQPLPDHLRRRLEEEGGGVYGRLLKRYKAEGLGSEPVDDESGRAVNPGIKLT